MSDSTDRPMKLVDGKLAPLTDEEIAQRATEAAEVPAQNPPPEPKDEQHGKRRSK
jgi:hypothetical protein